MKEALKALLEVHADIVQTALKDAWQVYDEYGTGDFPAVAREMRENARKAFLGYQQLLLSLLEGVGRDLSMTDEELGELENLKLFVADFPFDPTT